MILFELIKLQLTATKMLNNKTWIISIFVVFEFLYHSTNFNMLFLMVLSSFNENVHILQN